MRIIGYISLYLFVFLCCSCKHSSCVNNDAHTQKIANKKEADADCTVTYSGSKNQVIDLNKNCPRAMVINSGSGPLLVKSSHVLDVLTIVNNGSNNADLSSVQAKKVILHDRGSGILHLSALEEITGSSNGSGTIIVTGPGKNRIENKGSGTILGP